MDNLEQENVQDADRQMDRHDFQRQQFEIFKHNFREAIDEHDNGEAIHSLVLSSELRKDVVNMTRKLQKAQLNLQALKDPSPIQSVISKITEVNDQLLQLTKSSTEYSPQNVELPEFDQDDIELLFGHSTQQNQQLESFNQSSLKGMEWLKNFNEKITSKITELLGAGQLLLNECKEIKQYVKDN